MTIQIKKKTNYLCEYTLTRVDKSVEQITLETKTYLLHDVCHYVVEKNLNYSKGFWGMLASGHSFEELFGKDNPQTVELRFIEQIVGPVQSVYWGHISKENFATYIQHLDFSIPEETLTACISEITSIMQQWQQLIPGQELTLHWKLS
jgi:hypothetical protein